MTKKQEIVGLLASEEVLAEYGDRVKTTFSLGKAKDVHTANKRLFNGLRTLEYSEATVI